MDRSPHRRTAQGPASKTPPKSTPAAATMTSRRDSRPTERRSLHTNGHDNGNADTHLKNVTVPGEAPDKSIKIPEVATPRAPTATVNRGQAPAWRETVPTHQPRIRDYASQHCSDVSVTGPARIEMNHNGAI